MLSQQELKARIEARKALGLTAEQYRLMEAAGCSTWEQYQQQQRAQESALYEARYAMHLEQLRIKGKAKAARNKVLRSVRTGNTTAFAAGLVEYFGQMVNLEEAQEREAERKANL